MTTQSQEAVETADSSHRGGEDTEIRKVVGPNSTLEQQQDPNDSSSLPATKGKLKGKTQRKKWGQDQDDALVVLLKEADLYEKPDPEQTPYRSIWLTIWGKIVDADEDYVLKGWKKEYIQKKAKEIRNARMEQLGEEQRKGKKVLLTALDEEMEKLRNERLKALDEEMKIMREEKLKNLETEMKKTEDLRRAALNVSGGVFNKDSDEWRSIEKNVTGFISAKCESVKIELNNSVMGELEKVLLKKNN